MPARFAAAIESLFRVTPADAAALADRLFAANRRAYERVVNQQLEALGRPAEFRLTNSAQLKELRTQAVESARSIAATYNTQLAARVDRALAEEGTRGLNRTRLARILSDWDRERSGPKSEQISRTEAAQVAKQAVQTFVQASGLEGTVRYLVLPAGSADDDLNDRAARAGRLLEQREADQVFADLPAHVNERHSIAVAWPEGVEAEGLWTGA